MPKFKCLLIGDALTEFNKIANYAEHIPWLDIICKPVNQREARHYLQEFSIDIIIMDIATAADKEMAECCSSKLPETMIIVLAGENELKQREVQCNVFSYIGIPVLFDAFFNSISRARNYRQVTIPKMAVANTDFVFIKSEYKFFKIKFDEILFCEGMKDYTKIYLANTPKPLITLQNLKTFAMKLPRHNFIRVHRSFVISLSNVDVVTRTDIAIGQRSIPIGESYRNMLFSYIQ